MAKFNPVQFIAEVRQEVSKVTWPTRKEVVAMTIMVLILVILASLFFWIVDKVLMWVLPWVLGIR
ncbi:MAG: preprotein translocase subunit SecE [Hyphomicrobiaceae bacterium]